MDSSTSATLRAFDGGVESVICDSRRDVLDIPMFDGMTPKLLGTRDLTNLTAMRPKVLVIVTGGTICMTHEGVSDSLRPQSLHARLKEIADFNDKSLPVFDVNEWEELIDSSDVNLSHWVRIASEIEENYCSYDGFVVLHGTDTLAYTASALSFMLENLNKPVIVTGSMLPMHHIQTDARKNFAVALMVGAYSQITEVCVLFGSRLIRGNRSSKLDCSRMDAFSSPNFSNLGTVGVDITVDEQLLLLPSKRGFRVFPHFCMNIVVVTITPGFHTSLLRHLFNSPTRPLAVILKLYGSGTAPTRHVDLVNSIRCGIEAGVEVMSVTQCQSGTCSLLTYENGALFYHIGVIEGKDMTVEAAFAKLAYLMGKGYSGDKLRYLMESDIRGEVTERPSKVTGQASLASIIPQAMGGSRAIGFSGDSTKKPQSCIRCQTFDSRDPIGSDECGGGGSISKDCNNNNNEINISSPNPSLKDNNSYGIDSTAPSPNDESNGSSAANKPVTETELKDLVANIQEHAKEFRQLVAEIKKHALGVHPETHAFIHPKSEETQHQKNRSQVVPADLPHSKSCDGSSSREGSRFMSRNSSDTVIDNTIYDDNNNNISNIRQKDSSRAIDNSFVSMRDNDSSEADRRC